MELTRYTIGISFRFDAKEARRLDDHLKKLEKKFKAFSDKKLTFDISNFSVDQKKLNFALGNALDIASNRLTFQVSNFVIDQSRLNAMMRNAVSRASTTATVGTRVREVGPGASGRMARSAARSAGIGGAIGGGISRLYGPALALGAGGYGLSALNQRNQQVVAAQLQTQAVVQQAGGTAQQGRESFDFLRAQANRIGFNYLEAAPDYSKLLSGLTGAGVGLQESQQVFTGFAELARVNKLDRTQQNRLFRALSQVAGKGKLQAEELTGQIAEALPGGTALFARAYQRQIGGDKTGKEAISALMDAMKKGQVKSDILTFAAQLASEQAGPGLTAASRASQAEQARFQNVTSDLAILASQKGVEEGFARIFRTLNQGLSESGPLVEKLAIGFNEATKWTRELLLFPQSFNRMLEGRDSLVADTLFGSEEKRKEIFDFMGSIKTTLTEIDTLAGNISNGWSQIFQATGSSPFLSFLQNVLNTISNLAGALNDLAAGNYSGAAEKAKAGAFGLVRTVTTPGRAALEAAGFEANKTFEGMSPFDPAKFTSERRAEQARAIADLRRDEFPLISPYPVKDVNPAQVPSVNVEMIVNVANASPEDFGAAIEHKTQEIWGRVMQQYPDKGS